MTTARIRLGYLVFVATCLSAVSLAQPQWPAGAVARCGNGQFVFVASGADTCAAGGGVAEWRESADAKRITVERESGSLFNRLNQVGVKAGPVCDAAFESRVAGRVKDAKPFAIVVARLERSERPVGPLVGPDRSAWHYVKPTVAEAVFEPQAAGDVRLVVCAKYVETILTGRYTSGGLAFGATFDLRLIEWPSGKVLVKETDKTVRTPPYTLPRGEKEGHVNPADYAVSWLLDEKRGKGAFLRQLIG